MTKTLYCTRSKTSPQKLAKVIEQVLWKNILLVANANSSLS
jgi:hypothetical protein